MVNIYTPVQKERYNEKLIRLMDELATYMIKKGEPFRSRAYKKAEESLVLFPQDITSSNYKNIGLENLPGIGETMIKKIDEYIQTGSVRILEHERADPQNVLTDVYGIGPKKAQDLVEKNITTIQQLRERQNELLNDIQRTGLHYYEDILQRIPRDEIDIYRHVFEIVFNKVKELYIVNYLSNFLQGYFNCYTKNNHNNGVSRDQVSRVLLGRLESFLSI